MMLGLLQRWRNGKSADAEKLGWAQPGAASGNPASRDSSSSKGATDSGQASLVIIYKNDDSINRSGRRRSIGADDVTGHGFLPGVVSDLIARRRESLEASRNINAKARRSSSGSQAEQAERGVVEPPPHVATQPSVGRPSLNIHRRSVSIRRGDAAGHESGVASPEPRQQLSRSSSLARTSAPRSNPDVVDVATQRFMLMFVDTAPRPDNNSNSSLPRAMAQPAPWQQGALPQRGSWVGKEEDSSEGGSTHSAPLLSAPRSTDAAFVRKRRARIIIITQQDILVTGIPELGGAASKGAESQCSGSSNASGSNEALNSLGVLARQSWTAGQGLFHTPQLGPKLQAPSQRPYQRETRSSGGGSSGSGAATAANASPWLQMQQHRVCQRLETIESVRAGSSVDGRGLDSEPSIATVASCRDAHHGSSRSLGPSDRQQSAAALLGCGGGNYGGMQPAQEPALLTAAGLPSSGSSRRHRLAMQSTLLGSLQELPLCSPDGCTAAQQGQTAGSGAVGISPDGPSCVGKAAEEEPAPPLQHGHYPWLLLARSIDEEPSQDASVLPQLPDDFMSDDGLSSEVEEECHSSGSSLEVKHMDEDGIIRFKRRSSVDSNVAASQAQNAKEKTFWGAVEDTSGSYDL